VAEVVAGIVGVVKRTPQGERLEFKINTPGDLVAPIDESDLSEILGNLIENAARFARSTIRVDVASAGGRPTISVADDGPGVSEAERRSILARGVTAPGAEGGGSGLGLAIVSDIVDAYGGTLTMSDASPGLIVTIVLPAPT
jgi:signal transduction histidine kinase